MFGSSPRSSYSLHVITVKKKLVPVRRYLPLLELVPCFGFSLSLSSEHSHLCSLGNVPFLMRAMFNVPFDPSNGMNQSAFSHAVWCLCDLCLLKFSWMLPPRMPI